MEHHTFPEFLIKYHQKSEEVHFDQSFFTVHEAMQLPQLCIFAKDSMADSQQNIESAPTQTSPNL